MKEFSIIILTLLLILLSLYTIRQDTILRQTNEQVTELRALHKNYKEKIRQANERHSSGMQNAQNVIEETARQRDDLNRKLAVSRMKIESLKQSRTQLIEHIKKQEESESAETIPPAGGNRAAADPLQ